MPAKRSSTTRSRVQCSVCEKTFRGPFELKRHSILHSSDKSKYIHKCPIPDCPFTALQKSNLKTHTISVHLKIRTERCTVDPDACNADFCDAPSLIRHEKKVHGYFRKEGEFRPVKPVVRRTRTKRSTDDEIAEPLTQEQLTAMLSSGSLHAISSSPSPSTSTSPSNNSSSGYSSPSPSPSLPSPDALELEYPQYFTYPDASFAPMSVANQLPLDPAIYSTQAPPFYADASYYDLSAPEFVQGCSSASHSAVVPSTQETTYYGTHPPYLSEPEMSFGLLPASSSELATVSLASSEAKVEWSSDLPAPLIAELPSYFAPECPALNPISNNLLDIGSSAMFSSGSEFANISTEFDSFRNEIGMC
ncbi:hypothetical protein SCHPADRAFT_612822 [Schizopora paradoxa]|uniref:C2H2-type domain-containing protein n=1 Tax=Schizopora paradoxa TaxID=27342 RepID=A0A0H2RTZ7_9AGAM|nr:hypothetical protein SCHPADRAFT_612822 [Schizopora paradoxa]